VNGSLAAIPSLLAVGIPSTFLDFHDSQLLTRLIELVYRKIFCAANPDHVLPPLHDSLGHFWHLRCDLGGNGDHAVKISEQQLALFNIQMANPHRLSKAGDMRIGVRNGNVARKHLQAAGAYFRQVAHAPIGDHRYAAQRPQDVGVHLAYEGTQSRRIVQVLDHHNPRRRDRKNHPPPIGPPVVVGSAHGGSSAFDFRGYRVANHGREVRINASNAGVRKPDIGQTDPEAFD
jgi:hypothetical protein